MESHFVFFWFYYQICTNSQQNTRYRICLVLHGRKEGNVLFNDALNTFYLRLYGIGPLSERGNPLPPHGLLIPLAAKVLLYAPSHRQVSTYHGLCYTSHGALAGKRNSSMGPPHEGSIRRPIASRANALTTELHLAPVLHGL